MEAAPIDPCDAETASYIGPDKEEVLHPVFSPLFRLSPLRHTHRHVHHLDLSPSSRARASSAGH
jgi:hypothetical protein